MKNFRVSIRPEFFEDKKRSSRIGLEADREYAVLAILGDRLLVRGDSDNLIEVYPRWCRFVSYVEDA
jgi:hypothetical protein